MIVKLILDYVGSGDGNLHAWNIKNRNKVHFLPDLDWLNLGKIIEICNGLLASCLDCKCIDLCKIIEKH